MTPLMSRMRQLSDAHCSLLNSTQTIGSIKTTLLTASCTAYSNQSTRLSRNNSFQLLIDSNKVDSGIMNAKGMTPFWVAAYAGNLMVLPISRRSKSSMKKMSKYTLKQKTAAMPCTPRRKLGSWTVYSIWCKLGSKSIPSRITQESRQ